MLIANISLDQQIHYVFPVFIHARCYLVEYTSDVYSPWERGDIPQCIFYILTSGSVI